jgi:hypothetical protein
MEDDLKILKVEYLRTHLKLSLDDQTQRKSPVWLCSAQLVHALKMVGKPNFIVNILIEIFYKTKEIRFKKVNSNYD